MANVKGKNNFSKMPQYQGDDIIPVGGLAGEILARKSGGDYGLEWVPANSTGLNRIVLHADQVEYPRGTNWSVNVGAPASADPTNGAITIRRFDDSIVEAIGFSVEVPTTATTMTIRTTARAISTPPGTRIAKMSLRKRAIPDNAAVSSWSESALTDISLPTNQFFQVDTTTWPLASWGLTNGTTYQFQIARNASNAADTLSGDLGMFSVSVEFA